MLPPGFKGQRRPSEFQPAGWVEAEKGEAVSTVITRRTLPHLPDREELVQMLAILRLIHC